MFIPVAHAYNFIDVGSSAASTTLQNAGLLFSDFSTLIYTILGVLLFGTLVVFIIGAFRHH